MSWPPEVTLEGRHATLVPLRPEHADALREAVQDGELWRLWYTMVPTAEDMDKAIAARLELREKGAMLPFTGISAETGRPVGMTTYMNIDAAAPRVEIGATWYRGSVQRTPINTECKLMLLGHAFETLE